MRCGNTAMLICWPIAAAAIRCPLRRRFIADWNRRHRIDGVASFGASLFMRTMVTLVLNAIRLIGWRRVPAVLTKTEAAARAWPLSLRAP